MSLFKTIEEAIEDAVRRENAGEDVGGIQVDPLTGEHRVITKAEAEELGKIVDPVNIQLPNSESDCGICPSTSCKKHPYNNADTLGLHIGKKGWSV